MKPVYPIAIISLSITTVAFGSDANLKALIEKANTETKQYNQYLTDLKSIAGELVLTPDESSEIFSSKEIMDKVVGKFKTFPAAPKRRGLLVDATIAGLEKNLNFDLNLLDQIEIINVMGYYKYLSAIMNGTIHYKSSPAEKAEIAKILLNTIKQNSASPMNLINLLCHTALLRTAISTGFVKISSEGEKQISELEKKENVVKSKITNTGKNFPESFKDFTLLQKADFRKSTLYELTQIRALSKELQTILSIATI